ncbi:neuropeptide SIFamide receptor-like [Watersipora subatra]|uniref:neuropeptide SIFamide receptor-like n=1 Tax=Watersipora subatra TaxID=2589382 RepID=UPI00355B557A
MESNRTMRGDGFITYKGIKDSRELRVGVYSRSINATVICFFGLMSLLGICLNLYTIAVVKRSKRTRCCKLQLINLAVADTCTSIIMPMFLIYHILLIPFPGGEMCAKIFCFIGLSMFYLGPLCHIAISVERFVAVYFPFRMLRYRQNKRLVVIGSTWIVTMIASIEGLICGRISYFENSVYGKQIPMASCHDSNSNRTKYILTQSVKYILPAIIIATMYTLVTIKMCQQAKVSMEAAITDVKISNKQRRSKEMVKMLAISASLAIITWIPFEVICATGFDHNRKFIILTSLLSGLQLSNCFSTPIIYFAFNNSLRKEYRRSIQWVGSFISKKSDTTTWL